MPGFEPGSWRDWPQILTTRPHRRLVVVLQSLISPNTRSDQTLMSQNIVYRHGRMLQNTALDRGKIALPKSFFVRLC